ncbi:MAG: hypothetical protein ACLU9S_00520 [Oscillospiraceae bacterium]
MAVRTRSGDDGSVVELQACLDPGAAGEDRRQQIRAGMSPDSRYKIGRQCTLERYLVLVIDYQNDFVDGARGLPGAELGWTRGIAGKIRSRESLAT